MIARVPPILLPFCQICEIKQRLSFHRGIWLLEGKVLTKTLLRLGVSDLSLEAEK